MMRAALPFCFWIVGIGTLPMLISTSSAQSGLGGENSFMPSLQQMLQGVNPATVQELTAVSDTLEKNPRDVNALVRMGGLCLHIATKSPYDVYWVYLAGKTLEKALILDGNNFAARHNYAQACLQAGDMTPAQPNMHLAVIQFTKAIALNPRFARSYMGRGWAYLMLSDETHAQADFAKALQLDPSLRPQLMAEASAIRDKVRQLRGVPGTLQRMGRYIVERRARNASECAAYKGYWTNSECRISMAMNPVP